MSDGARQEITFSLSTAEHGTRNFKILDRINVDDVYRHMVMKELFRMVTGVDEGNEVSREYRNFLILDDFLVR
jgi:hypothetical protein